MSQYSSSDEVTRDNILTVASGILSKTGETRIVAAERQKALEFKPEYPICLSEIMKGLEEPEEERLMCGVMLKSYVLLYWIEHPSFCINDVKAAVRSNLAACLGDSASKISRSAANILATIAIVDFPDAWTDMLEMLSGALTSPNANFVYGGMVFMEECFHLIPYTFYVFMPSKKLCNHLYSVIENEQHTSSLRSKAVDMATNYILDDFFHCYKHTPEASASQVAAKAERVKIVAIRYSSLLGHMVSQPYGPASDFQLKAAIINVYTKFLRNVPEMVDNMIISALPVIWNILTMCAVEYREIVARTRCIPMDLGENATYPVHFMALVDSIFKLIQHVSMTEKIRANIATCLPDIFNAMLVFMCITPYNEQEVYEIDFEYGEEADANAVVSNMTRTGLRSLLQTLAKSYTMQQALYSLEVAITGHLSYLRERNAGNQAAAQGSPIAAAAEEVARRGLTGNQAEGVAPSAPAFARYANTYDLYTSRITESIMYALGAIADVTADPERDMRVLLQPLGDGPRTFHIGEFLNHWQSVVDVNDCVLNCRLMVTVAKNCWIFVDREYMIHLSHLAANLRSDQIICRNAAVRALSLHCTYLLADAQRPPNRLEAVRNLQAIFLEICDTFLDRLLDICLQSTADILVVILRNIGFITQMKQISRETADILVALILNVLVKHIDSARVVDGNKKLIEEVTSHRLSAVYFLTHLTEPLLSLIQDPTRCQANAAHAKAVSMEIFSVLVRVCSHPATQQNLLTNGFPVITAALLLGPITDADVTVAGVQCINQYLMRYGTLMQEMPAVQCSTLVRVLHHILAPNQPEDACHQVDRMCLGMAHVFYAELGGCVDALVRSLLSRINFNRSPKVRETLVMTFITLFYYYQDNVMMVLRMLPAPDGTCSALAYVAPMLLDGRYTDAYTQNMYVLVLTKLLESGLIGRDGRIVELEVEHNYAQQRRYERPGTSVAGDAAPTSMSCSSSSSLMSTPRSGGNDAAALAPISAQQADASTSGPLEMPPPRDNDGNAEGDAGAASMTLGASARSIEHALAIPRISLRASRAELDLSRSDVADTGDESGTASGGFSASAEHRGAPLHSQPPFYSADFGVDYDFPSGDEVDDDDDDAMELGSASGSSGGAGGAAAGDTLSIMMQRDSIVERVPFMRKAFRNLLDILLRNSRVLAQLSQGENAGPGQPGERQIGRNDVLFPDADRQLDLCSLLAMTQVATLDVVHHIETFFFNVVKYNLLGQLTVNMNLEHEEEVNRLLEAYGTRQE